MWHDSQNPMLTNNFPVIPQGDKAILGIMTTRELHPWNVDLKDALKIQESLNRQVVINKLESSVNFIAGADVSYSIEDSRIYGAVIVFDWPKMKVMEEATISLEAQFPYIPGFLSFREGPALIEAMKRIKVWPDLIFFDGQGIAHPRGLGLASHMGVILDLPSIGCAKNKLIGEYGPVGEEIGSYSPLLYKERVVGVALRTREKVKPVFISPGHKIDLQGSIYWTLLSCRGFRLPEPIRQAHLRVNKMASIR